MFLLVSVRHVGAHPGEHGVSIQISISLVKRFFGYLVYEIFLRPESWRGSLYMYLLSFSRFWTLSIDRFWFLFWSILNGVTMKTSNNYASFCKLCSFYTILALNSEIMFLFFTLNLVKSNSITRQQTSKWQTHYPYLHLETLEC